MPLVITLILQSLNLIRFELTKLFKTVWVACHEGPLAEKSCVLLHTVSLSPFASFGGSLLG